MVSTIFAFQRKLCLFTLQLECENSTHFPACRKLLSAGENQKSVTVTYAPYVENLLPEFQLRLEAIEVEKANYYLFHNHFSAAPGDSDPTVQLELIDLKCSPVLKRIHSESQLLCKNLDKNKYRNLVGRALKLMSVFGSTYVCEQTFSLMTLNKNRL